MPQVVITKIVREFQPLTVERHGLSVGQQIDAHVQRAIDKGEEVQAVTLQFDPENPGDFFGFRQTMFGTEPGIYDAEAPPEPYEATRKAKR